MLCYRYINILNNIHIKRTLHEHKYFFKFKLILLNLMLINQVNNENQK